MMPDGFPTHLPLILTASNTCILHLSNGSGNGDTQVNTMAAEALEPCIDGTSGAPFEFNNTD